MSSTLWKEIKLTCQQGDLEQIEDFLLQQGACSVTYQDSKDQPILEPQAGENPLWDKIVLIALFTDKYDIEGIANSLTKQSLSRKILGSINTRVFKDQDWTRTWMEDFKPMQFGQRLWVYPSWEEVPEQADKTILLLDPGLAFGTGTHQTTALCLEYLDTHIKHNETVIDYGCGSGILAIAAKKLGAKQVIGIDNDPQAILASNSNAQKNTLTNNINFYLANEAPIIKADIVIANILASILIMLSSEITQRVKAGGKLVLCGILDDQVNDVINAYQNDFTFTQPQNKDEWVLLTGIKK